jgi:hypothetical protein
MGLLPFISQIALCSLAVFWNRMSGLAVAGSLGQEEALSGKDSMAVATPETELR